MKLIKINTDHYIIVDDSEIREGDYFYSIRNLIEKAIINYSIREHIGKITHSTQPLGIGWQQEVIELTLSEVKELLGEVDIEKKVVELYNNFKLKPFEAIYPLEGATKRFVENVYNQALEDNKKKKYTEEDLRKIIEWLNKNYSKVEDELAKPYQDKGEDLYDGFFKDAYEEALKRAINSIQPKTEWEVEIVDGKLKLK